MKKFLAVYIGSTAGWSALDEEERQQRQQAGIKAWGDWVAANRSAFVDLGTPLGKTKRVSGQGIADVRNAMTAYVIVQAESHEMAARLFNQHPHFMIFPGDSVEVMECLPLPG